MKTLSAYVLGFIMTLAMVGTVYHAANNNTESTAVCLTVFVASAVFMPQGKATGVLGFNNKSYFNGTDKPYTRAELALIEYLMENGKGQTQVDAASGKLKLETYAKGFRFKIPNNFTGRAELLNAASVALQGAIPEEFNLGQLPDGFNIAVSHVRASFVADASVTVAQGAVNLVNQPNSWPAALRNGQLVFSQASSIKQYFDVAACGSAAASQGKYAEEDGLELQAPFILEENKATKFELITASGQSFGAPVGGNYLELFLYGAFVRLRA